MEKYADKYLKEIRKLNFRNKELLEKSNQCGCSDCLTIYPPSIIAAWIEESSDKRKNEGCNYTAICPVCGIDCVVGDATGVEITKHLLAALSGAYPELNPSNYDFEVRVRTEENKFLNERRKSLGLPEEDIYTGDTNTSVP